ncbi:hypothetical protein [Geodermatophilus sp. SYSU D00698]
MGPPDDEVPVTLPVTVRLARTGDAAGAPGPAAGVGFRGPHDRGDATGRRRVP